MDLTLSAIFVVALVAVASPGPAVLAIIGAALAQGRRPALALAGGVMTASLVWSFTAALGLAAAMSAHATLIAALRFAGGAYLLYLAYRSARAALRDSALVPIEASRVGLAQNYRRGLILHLANPKPILFFGSLFAIVAAEGASPSRLLIVVAVVALPSAAVFFGYAILFAYRPLVDLYRRLRRWIEGAFALVFAVLGIRLLTGPALRFSP